MIWIEYIRLASAQVITYDVSESPMTYPNYQIQRLASFIIIYDNHDLCSCGFQTRSPFTNFTNVHSDFHGFDFQRLGKVS